MKITSCVPLPGPGVIARYGALVAVTDGRGPVPDPLLSALAEVAAAEGDGSDLVRMAARAALGCPGQPAWACAGVTADGGVAVLVHGHAVASVSVAGGPGFTLSASDSVIPVSRTYTGSTVTLGLAIGEPAAPDPRCWLGGGVVPGGGLAVTVSAGLAAPARQLADVPAADPGWPESQPTVVSSGTAESRPPGQAPATEAAREDAGEDAALNGSGTGEPAIGDGDGDDAWFASHPSSGPAGWHPPTVVAPSAGLPFTEAPEASEQDPLPPVLVEGVLCGRDHFNDPSARTCRQCGSTLDQPPRNFQRRPRPPLGVLVLDDGTRVTLDGDYVFGREPALDGDVMAGRARPLRISDPEGTVSRLHLRIFLTGWQVEASDLGSVNGSVLQSSGGEHALAPFEPAVVEPGAWIGIGHRSMQYLAYQGVLP
jgi:hypothetical protein